MRIKIKPVYHLLILLAGVAASAGACLLLNYFLAGPRLGAHYDFLASYNKSQAVSRNILIINTGALSGKNENFIYKAAPALNENDKLLVLTALIEMNGEALVMTDKDSAPAPLSVNEAEIRSRFYEEYALLSANIRNLFSAIRSGLVTPSQAPDYVETLVELAEQGRDRLLSALSDRDEDLIKAIGLFGNYAETYENPEYDKDGKLRRVAPVNLKTYFEHPVYSLLKKNKTSFSFDGGGNIITPWKSEFRNIDITLFREYEEARLLMREVLAYGDGLGAFSQVLPEQSPLFLGDYSEIFFREMLDNPGDETRAAWLRSREDYYKSLEAFVNGNAESLTINNFNEIIMEEDLSALVLMRDELIQAFVFIRAQYDKLREIRETLKNELNASFCIMGNYEKDSGNEPSDAKYAALLANALITGSHITPVENKYALIWTMAAAFFVLCASFWLRPLYQLMAGACLSVLAAAAFCVLFVYYSHWIDPLIALGASLAGTFTVFLIKQSAAAGRKKLFAASYGPCVEESALKELIRLGRPNPKETVNAYAAVVAIKDINLLYREEREKQEDAGTLRKTFFASVKEAVFSAGGIVAGFEGDTIIACFGSPLDIARARDSKEPAEKARLFIKKCLANEKIAWRFGMDAGNCVFYWSEETGFSVHGKPGARARLLASRTVRLRTRALITEHARHKLNLQIEKTDSLFENSEPVFALP